MDEQFDIEDGRYQHLEMIGRGGMGVVHKCQDTTMGRVVAVKLLHANPTDEIATRFHTEARATARLEHPNIIKVLDFGQLPDGRLYLIMEFIEGSSLKSMIRSTGGLSFEDASSILLQICQGLKHSHSKGILHRDVKPSNVMLMDEQKPRGESQRDKRVKLLDFGLAKLSEETDEDKSLTRTGSAVGSPPYISPEAVRGMELSNASDVYSFGCLMFELLTGRRPFKGGTSVETMMMHLNQPAPRLSLSGEFPEALEELIRRCLEKSPADRYDSFEQVILELDEIKGNTASGLLSATGFNIKPSQDTSLSRMITALLSIMLAGAIAYFGMFVYQNIGIFRSSELKPTEAEKHHDLFTTIGKLKPGLAGTRGEYTITGNVDGDREELKFLLGREDISSLLFELDDLQGDTLAHLERLPLRRLVLWGCEVNDGTIACLGAIDSLDYLSLSRCGGLSRVSFTQLGGIKKLTGLSLVRTAVNDDGLRQIATTLPELEYLSLFDCHELTDASLDTIVQMKRLKRLILTYSSLDVDAVDRTRFPQSLQELVISRAVKDLTGLVRRNGLKELGIYGNATIQDSDLMPLTGERRLKKLVLTNCSNVTEQLKRDFESIRPDCQVSIAKRQLDLKLPI